MKKQVLGMLACLVMCVMLWPMKVEAASGVYVGEVDLNTNDYYLTLDITGASGGTAIATGDSSNYNVWFDGTTLHLNGFNYSGPGAGTNAAAIYCANGLTIDVKADSSITYDATNQSSGAYCYGIYTGGNLVIEGNSKLTITADKSQSSSSTLVRGEGIHTEGSLEVDGAEVVGACLETASCYGVESKGDVTVNNGGSLTATSTGGNYNYGISIGDSKTLTVNDGAVQTNANDFPISAAGTFTVQVQSGTLEAIGSGNSKAIISKNDSNAAITVTLGSEMAAKAGTDANNANITNVDNADYYKQPYVYIAKGVPVAYDANGGSQAPDTKYYLQGMNISLSSTVPTAPANGYTFAGWDTSAAAGTAVYQAGATYTVGTANNLYAVWEGSYAVTVDSNIANGTVTASAASQDTNESVTLTVTPASGYKLKSLKVHKTSDSTVTVPVSGNTFTMPAYAVTITAEFVQDTGNDDGGDSSDDSSSDSGNNGGTALVEAVPTAEAPANVLAESATAAIEPVKDAVPKTGETTPWVLCSLLIVSGLGILVLSRRRKASGR